MAAAAAGGAGDWKCSSEREMEVMDEGEFSEREMEVAGILVGLKSTFRARLDVERRPRPEIPSWGKRRRRTTPTAEAENPVGVAAAAGDSRGECVASPNTPLAFPEGRGDNAADEEEKRGDEAAADKKARAHEEWVASLSHENAHLMKIEEFYARLQSSRRSNDGLKKIQSKHKKRPLPQREENEEGEDRKRKLHAAAGWPALGLDLNVPAAEAEEMEPVAAAQWPHQRDQLEEQQKAAVTAAARRRRQLIRRAKAAAIRTRRLG